MKNISSYLSTMVLVVYNSGASDALETFVRSFGLKDDAVKFYSTAHDALKALSSFDEKVLVVCSSRVRFLDGEIKAGEFATMTKSLKEDSVVVVCDFADEALYFPGSTDAYIPRIGVSDELFYELHKNPAYKNVQRDCLHDITIARFIKKALQVTDNEFPFLIEDHNGTSILHTQCEVLV